MPVKKQTKLDLNKKTDVMAIIGFHLDKGNITKKEWEQIKEAVTIYFDQWVYDPVTNVYSREEVEEFIMYLDNLSGKKIDKISIIDFIQNSLLPRGEIVN